MALRKVSRRKFMETSVAGAAAMAEVAGPLGCHSDSKLADEGETYPPGPRIVHSLNENWKFRRQASPGSGTEPEFVGAEQLSYNDSSWATLWLPHTWDATPDNPFATSGHFHGVGWYRTRFEAPAVWTGRKVWLHFKGAFQVTDVWVNGEHAGQHIGGYTSFAFDVTRLLRPGRSNLVAVKVDSMPSVFIAPTDETNVAQYGGIYRSVSIEVMNPLHVRYDGIWITFEGGPDKPVVRIRTWVVNQGRQARQIRLESSVLDAHGQLTTKVEASAETGPGEEKAFDQRTEAISNAHLWSPG
jgi:beta-galactosidase